MHMYARTVINLMMLQRVLGGRWVGKKRVTLAGEGRDLITLPSKSWITAGPG